MIVTATRRIYNSLIAKADPRVKEWTFMSDPGATVAVLATYLALIYVILPAYMKNRKPYKLRRVIQTYNIFQIIACTSLIYMILVSGYVQGEVSLGCQPVDYSDNPLAMQMLNAIHWTYWLKMAELIETIFFVLRKKYNQVTKLHVYHHCATLSMVWVACKFIGGGMISLPIVLNSFVHILMYSYYYFASLGPKWQKKLAPWKPKLTMIQMIQFTILILHSLTSLHPSCDIPSYMLILYLPNVVIIYKMFYDFYNDSYKTKNDIKHKTK